MVWYGQVRNVAAGLDARMTSGVIRWTIRPTGAGLPVVLSTALTNINDQFSYILTVPLEGDIPGTATSPNTLRHFGASRSVSRIEVDLIINSSAQRLEFAVPSSSSFLLDAGRRGQTERMDLVLRSVAPDSDGDGLPDYWEKLYPSAGVPSADSDGDGVDNLAEYLAGTNPLDRNSLFAFISLSESPDGGVILRWSSVEGKHYTILRSASLSTDPLDYLSIQRNVPATAGVTTFRDPAPKGAGPFFYRLELEE